VEQEGASTKKSKFEKLMMGKKPDHNDGDVENFYSKDPSKYCGLIIFRQA
jgi:hypothetical protein